MQKLAFFIPLFGLLLLSSNCSKDSSLRSSLVYSETKCSDPWMTNGGNTEAEVETALIDFLENDLMIANSTVKITANDSDLSSCEACSCTTGRKITVEVEKEFVPILEDNGFTLTN